MATPPTTIMLWCHPRSTSTMFERAFLTRPDDFRVLHEPMGDPWYFGRERASARFSRQACVDQHGAYVESTFGETWKNITSPAAAGQRNFAKEMAYYVFLPPNPVPTAPSLPEEAKGNPTLLPEEDLVHPSVIHTFLIRTPQKSVPSFYRLCSGEESKTTQFEYFDKNEVGLHQLKQLYQLIQRKTGKVPLIIDSEDLLANPEVTMRLYCEHVGVDFQPSMLCWESGQPEHFKKWPGWHTDAEKSTGIQQKPATNGHSQTGLPKDVVEAIQENMEVYEWLRERRLKLS